MIPWLFKTPAAMTRAEYAEYLLFAMRLGAIRARLLYWMGWGI